MERTREEKRGLIGNFARDVAAAAAAGVVAVAAAAAAAVAVAAFSSCSSLSACPLFPRAWPFKFCAQISSPKKKIVLGLISSSIGFARWHFLAEIGSGIGSKGWRRCCHFPPASHGPGSGMKGGSSALEVNKGRRFGWGGRSHLWSCKFPPKTFFRYLDILDAEDKMKMHPAGIQRFFWGGGRF